MDDVYFCRNRGQVFSSLRICWTRVWSPQASIPNSHREALAHCFIHLLQYLWVLWDMSGSIAEIAIDGCSKSNGTVVKPNKPTKMQVQTKCCCRDVSCHVLWWVNSCHSWHALGSFKGGVLISYHFVNILHPPLESQWPMHVQTRENIAT